MTVQSLPHYRTRLIPVPDGPCPEDVDSVQLLVSLALRYQLFAAYGLRCPDSRDREAFELLMVDVAELLGAALAASSGGFTIRHRGGPDQGDPEDVAALERILGVALGLPCQDALADVLGELRQVYAEWTQSERCREVP